MERSAVGALCRPAGVGTRHRAKAVDREVFSGLLPRSGSLIKRGRMRPL